MIPQAYITEWQNTAPWQSTVQIEQDLILSRILVEIYQNEFLKDQLLFRGGTALHKLFFSKPLRYSEDLDFVQQKSGHIKPIVQTIQKTIDPWLGKSKTQPRRDGFRVYYHFIPEADPEGKKRIKIEINTREHFAVFPIIAIDYKVESQWFTDQAAVRIYQMNELAGTKLRALFQRKKGRDLFDLYKLFSDGLTQPDQVVHAFKEYIKFQGLSISKQDFLDNLDQKLRDYVFLHDLDTLLLPMESYDPNIAGEEVKKLINQLD